MREHVARLLNGYIINSMLKHSSNQEEAWQWNTIALFSSSIQLIHNNVIYPNIKYDSFSILIWNLNANTLVFHLNKF